MDGKYENRGFMKKSLMEEEISQQSGVLKELISKYVVNYCVMVNFPAKFKRVKFIASGSSYHCACIGQRFFEDIAGVETACEFSSEFLINKNRIIDPETLYFFISQSGETADTLAIMEIVQEKKATCFALTNNIDSTLSKKADYTLSIEAGVESSIAATKSFSASVFCVWLCALKLAQSKSKNISKYLENLEKLPAILDELLLNQEKVNKAAKFLSKFKSLPIVGYNYYFAAAKEGALKIKETSYIDANAYALGEFLHGHVAVLNQKMPLLEIFTDDLGAIETRNLNKIHEQYKPKTIVITDSVGYKDCEVAINFPKFENDLIKCLCVIILLQLLALKTALCLKRDVDNPFGLSKVVGA